MRQRLSRFVPLLGVALAVGALAGGCAEDSPTTDFELTGYIRNELDGAAIGGAMVRFTSDTLYTAATTSDDDGLYEMVVSTDYPFGQVRAERTGFMTGEGSVFFDTPQRRLDIRMRPQE